MQRRVLLVAGAALAALALCCAVGSASRLHREHVEHLSALADESGQPSSSSSSALLEAGRRWVSFAFGAYCRAALINSWTCQHCQRDGVGNTTEALAMEASNTESLVYVAVNNAHREIVVSFRGTVFSNAQNIGTDIGLVGTGNVNVAGIPADVSLHRGFWTTWINIRSQTPLVKELQKRIRAHPEYAVIFTGHSLGAALATLAAAHMKVVDKIDSRVVTFGSPRVGNVQFARWFTKLLPVGAGGLASKSLRFVHKDDIVTQLPPSGIIGYVHVAQQIWNNPDDSTLKLCSTSDGEDSTCIGGANSDDHLRYLGIQHRCDSVAYSGNSPTAPTPTPTAPPNNNNNRPSPTSTPMPPSAAPAPPTSSSSPGGTSTPTRPPGATATPTATPSIAPVATAPAPRKL